MSLFEAESLVRLARDGKFLISFFFMHRVANKPMHCFRAGARHHVEGIPDAYYQAFCDGRMARRWWKEHRSEVVNHGPLGTASPLDNHDPTGPVPAANR